MNERRTNRRRAAAVAVAAAAAVLSSSGTSTTITPRACAAFLVSQHAGVGPAPWRRAKPAALPNQHHHHPRRLFLSSQVLDDVVEPAGGADPAVSSPAAENNNSSDDDDESYLSQLQRTPGGQRPDAVAADDRLFSTLEYYTQDGSGDGDGDGGGDDGQTILRVRHAPGSLGGAVALIAGTACGAGVLALPAATASAGFVPSTAALAVAWAAMATSGLLLAELSLHRMAATGRAGQGLLDLLRSNLGGPLQALGTAAYFFLHYAVMVAYMAQGGSNVDTALGGGSILGVGIPGPVAFAAVTGTALGAASPRAVERANGALVVVVAASFAGILGLGAPTADFAGLLDPARQHPAEIVAGLPVLVLSLVYQNVVPTVVAQLEGNRRKIVTAIVAGTAAPLLLFVAWNAVVLGNVPAVGDVSGGSSLDPVALLQQQATNGGGGGSATTTAQLLGPLVTAFSTSALVTSVVGFTYGLLDAWTDVFRVDVNSPEYEQKWKLPLLGLVFGPPVLLSLLNPDAFYAALECGGAFGVSTLFLFLPAVMVWKQRYGRRHNRSSGSSVQLTPPLVPLGKVPLAALGAGAVGLVGQQGADKLGQLLSGI